MEVEKVLKKADQKTSYNYSVVASPRQVRQEVISNEQDTGTLRRRRWIVLFFLLIILLAREKYLNIEEAQVDC